MGLSGNAGKAIRDSKTKCLISSRDAVGVGLLDISVEAHKLPPYLTTDQFVITIVRKLTTMLDTGIYSQIIAVFDGVVAMGKTSRKSGQAQHPIANIHIALGPTEADATIAALSRSLGEIGIGFPTFQALEAVHAVNQVVPTEFALKSEAHLRELYRIATDEANSDDNSQGGADELEEDKLADPNPAQRFATLIQPNQQPNGSPTQVVVSRDNDFFQLLPSDAVVMTGFSSLSRSTLATIVSYSDVHLHLVELMSTPQRPLDLDTCLTAVLAAKSKAGDYGLPIGDGFGWLKTEKLALEERDTQKQVKLLAKAVQKGRQDHQDNHSKDLDSIRYEILRGRWQDFGHVVSSEPLWEAPSGLVQALIRLGIPKPSIEPHSSPLTPPTYTLSTPPHPYINRARQGFLKANGVPSGEIDAKGWWALGVTLGASKAEGYHTAGFGTLLPDSEVGRSYFPSSWSLDQQNSLPRLPWVQDLLDVALSEGAFDLSYYDNPPKEEGEVEEEEGPEAEDAGDETFPLTAPQIASYARMAIPWKSEEDVRSQVTAHVDAIFRSSLFASFDLPDLDNLIQSELHPDPSLAKTGLSLFGTLVADISMPASTPIIKTFLDHASDSLDSLDLTETLRQFFPPRSACVAANFVTRLAEHCDIPIKLVIHSGGYSSFNRFNLLLASRVWELPSFAQRPMLISALMAPKKEAPAALGTVPPYALAGLLVLARDYPQQLSFSDADMIATVEGGRLALSDQAVTHLRQNGRRLGLYVDPVPPLDLSQQKDRSRRLKAPQNLPIDDAQSILERLESKILQIVPVLNELQEVEEDGVAEAEEEVVAGSSWIYHTFSGSNANHTAHYHQKRTALAGSRHPEGFDLSLYPFLELLTHSLPRTSAVSIAQQLLHPLVEDCAVEGRPLRVPLQKLIDTFTGQPAPRLLLAWCLLASANAIEDAIEEPAKPSSAIVRFEHMETSSNPSMSIIDVDLSRFEVDAPAVLSDVISKMSKKYDPKVHADIHYESYEPGFSYGWIRSSPKKKADVSLPPPTPPTHGRNTRASTRSLAVAPPPAHVRLSSPDDDDDVVSPPTRANKGKGKAVPSRTTRSQARTTATSPISSKAVASGSGLSSKRASEEDSQPGPSKRRK